MTANRHVIFKYPITAEATTISVTGGGTPMTVQVQGDQPYVWIDQEVWEGFVPTIPLEFVVVGTGHSFDWTGWIYLGTFQLLAGDFVGHVFWREAP